MAIVQEAFDIPADIMTKLLTGEDRRNRWSCEICHRTEKKTDRQRKTADMFRNMKRSFLLLNLAAILAFLLSGCGSRIDDSLPDNPVRFETGTFVNPYDPEDTYLTIRYNGRTYIGYGTLEGNVNGKDIGSCLGFIVQDGVQLENARIFLLSADPEENYLGRFETEGIMNQPDFFRAIDTMGQEIYTPDYITDAGYDVWRLGPVPEVTDLDAFYRYDVVKDYRDIRDLGEAYDKGQAQMDHCFVVGAMVHNDDLYYEFMEKSRNNEDAFIRVVQSTTEGDTVIYDVLHIAGTEEQAEEVQLVVDATRETFPNAASAIRGVGLQAFSKVSKSVSYTFAAEADRNITLTHYTGTMEYEEDGHLYWVAYKGNPEDVSLDDEGTFVIVFIG